MSGSLLQLLERVDRWDMFGRQNAGMAEPILGSVFQWMTGDAGICEGLAVSGYGLKPRITPVCRHNEMLRLA